MPIEMSKRKYKITGITPILGTQPAAQDIRTKYLASRAPSEWQGQEETKMLPKRDQEVDPEIGMTVFLRDPKTDSLCVLDYMVLGFLKEALTSLQSQIGIKQPRSKVDKYLFIAPRILPLRRRGKGQREEDAVLERPLRAETMQGPRQTLAASEQVNDPWTLQFQISLLDNAGTPKSKALTWDAIEMALDYGSLRGLGQWRNAGYGRFKWCVEPEGAHE